MIYSIPVLILIASVPWFFTGTGGRAVMGFPPWAFYSLLISVLYAVVVAAFLKYYWAMSAEDAESNDEDGV